VHWNRDDKADEAVIVLAAAEDSWRIQVDEMGFRAPVLPDSLDGPELDIYIHTSGGGGAWVDGEGWPYIDVTPDDGYNGTPSYMVLSPSIPVDELPSYVAHEFQHVTQYATDFVEPTYPIWEAVATAAEWWTFAYPEWDYAVYSFQEVPYAPTLLADSYAFYYDFYLGGYYEYGAALWVLHLDQVLRDGTGQSGVDLWQATAQEGLLNDPDPIDAVQTASGQTLGAFLNGVARTRWLTGADWDDRGLADAADWGRYEKVPHDDLMLGDLPRDHIFAPAPMITGQAFVEVDVSGGTGPLVVSTDSRMGNDSGLLLLWWAADGTVGEVEAEGATPEVRVDLDGLSRVVVALTNLGPSDFDGDDLAYIPGDQVLHMELDGDVIDPLVLTPADPGLPGVLNSWTISGATPGGSVAIVAGVAGAGPEAPGCPGLNVAIARPKLLGRTTADADGDAVFERRIPDLSGTFLVQAVDLDACTTSTPVDMVL
jgi:hypothetical protein